MTWSEIGFFALVVCAALVFLAWQAASRLDRLHRKVAASRIALDAQLVRRATAALDLASSGTLDPASSVLVAEAAYQVMDDVVSIGLPPTTDRPDPRGRRAADVVAAALAMDGLGAAREHAESDLSATLREALGSAQEVRELRSADPGDQLVGALAAAWYRASLARRFHNEAVAQAQRVRRLWYVRFLHLAGRAPMPLTVELDDALPDGLDPVAG
ncbi:hypothetical protein L1785_12865 [Antribacter sp. KLBMP9083]|uniref:LemA family protein n=1 Tax=Antribacter soli TaxID=2910976 RepID=A0AA41U7Y5_9MICO|nr:hypothetical protein [Antribacter soli]MCF4121875.1 hypothetical protein [Antribacter soli]